MMQIGEPTRIQLDLLGLPFIVRADTKHGHDMTTRHYMAVVETSIWIFAKFFEMVSSAVVKYELSLLKSLASVTSVPSS